MADEQDLIRAACPHCDGPIEVLRQELRCRIFRHAAYKASGEQVGPHLPKDECDRLTAEGLVHGCCKPFRYNDQTAAFEQCDYI